MKDNWTYIITPKRRWLDLNLKEYWRYKDLYITYVRRDFIAAYKQTILGPFWHILQPLLTMIIYIFIFGDLAGISTEGLPKPLFYFSGIMLWNYFCSSFSCTAGVLVSNSGLFSKVYFPRLIIPLSNVTSNVFKLFIQLGIFFIIYLYFYINGASISLNWAFGLSPILLFMIALMSFSWGLIFSSITYKYRDLRELVNFGLQLFMFITPVVYPINAIPDKFKILIELNPLSAIFETFRYGAMGAGEIQWWNLVYSFFFAIISLILSILIFNRVEKKFIDTI